MNREVAQSKALILGMKTKAYRRMFCGCIPSLIFISEILEQMLFLILLATMVPKHQNKIALSETIALFFNAFTWI